MNRLEKIQYAIEKGYRYDAETGIVYGLRGKALNRKDDNGYICIRIKDKNVGFNLRAHLLGWYWVHDEIVNELDHINNNPADNRIVNLRSVTHSQNSFNKPSVKGYYLHKASGKYQVRITVNRKTTYLGEYKTEEEARQKYLEEKKKRHLFD
jgi:hypothetical protein